MIDEATISTAAQTLLEAAPGSRVILFGSHARGDAGPDSDMDFLVVEPDVDSRAEEMVRLRETLRHLRIPVDVVVVSREVFEKWAETPGTVYHEAAQEGRVYADLEQSIRTAPVRKRPTTGEGAGTRNGGKYVEQAWPNEVTEALPPLAMPAAARMDMSRTRSCIANREVGDRFY